MNNIEYILDCCSETGNFRLSNQDACCVRILKTPSHTVVMAVVCDGAGGMSEGEYASRNTIRVLNHWFDYELNRIVLEEKPEDMLSVLSEDMKLLIHEQNAALYEYGRQKGIRIGTTLTAMLFVNQNYFTVQIGDSRACVIRERLTWLTEDQSLVAREIREGRMTEQEARCDKRRNIILQCMGATEHVTPVYGTGVTQKGASYFVCSDGLVHELENDELETLLKPDDICDRNEAHTALCTCIHRVMERGEKDNITVVLVRTL